METPQQVVAEIRIVLPRPKGAILNSAIAVSVTSEPHTVILLRQRFLSAKVREFFGSGAGQGRRSRPMARKIQAIVKATLQTQPKGMTMELR